VGDDLTHGRDLGVALHAADFGDAGSRSARAAFPPVDRGTAGTTSPVDGDGWVATG
jgi:hypothetical protein